MADLYSNENFPLPVVEELRRLGHGVLTTQEAGNAGQAIPDEAVLKFAIDNNRTLLTINRKHFIRLHQQDANHAGIIVCRSYAVRIPSSLEKAYRGVQPLQTTPFDTATAYSGCVCRSTA